jgi:hypothetical protein
MADIDLKTETPDTTLPTTGFLFGADSQAAASPSVFTVQSVATTLLGSTTLTGATVTTSSPVIDAAQTWNAGGVTFTGLKLNITDTASNAASLLMDLQVGGTSLFSVRKDGTVLLSTTAGFKIQSGSTLNFYTSTLTSPSQVFTVSSIRLRSDTGIYTIGGSDDVVLGRRGAANLRFGAADAAAPVAQTLSVQSVVAGTTNIAGANLTITGSQGTGTGAGGSIIFQVAPAGSSGTAQNALATALTINSAGVATFAGQIVTALNSGISFQNSISLLSNGSNNFQFVIGGGTFIFNRETVVLGALCLDRPFQLRDTASYSWSSTSAGNGAPDLILLRDAANTLAQRNGANAQAFRVYNTFTDATTFERANIFWDSNVLKIGTEKGSVGGTARALELQTDGTTRLTIAATGTVTFTEAITANKQFTSNLWIWAKEKYFLGTAATVIASASDGVIALQNNASTDFGRLQFGGTTSSFPALKRSSASLIVRLADDTANAALESASLKTDAPTGGTAATWKLGTVASVTPTSPDRTIEVDIGGTIYYLSAKTTND